MTVPGLLSLCMVTSLLSPGLCVPDGSPDHTRLRRSATACDSATAASFGQPRLQVNQSQTKTRQSGTFQVFLTVNSLAKVYWDGTFEKRRLELNWVNPPDVQREDYVGLFRVDPQWFGISSEMPFVTRV